MKNFLFRTLFIIIALFIYKLGTYITIPALNPSALGDFLNNQNSNLLQTINMFSGGGIERLSILILGIMPFITAAIIIQFIALIVPYMKELNKSGEKGQIQINRYVKYLTFFIGTIQSIILSFIILNLNHQIDNIITSDLISYFIIFNVSCISGIFITVFIAEKINEYGYGSGVSFIIFANIASSLPTLIQSIIESIKYNNSLWLWIFITCVFILFAFSIILENAKKKIPLSSPDMSQNNYLPIKINLATIMPAIFVFMLFSLIMMVEDGINKISGFSLSLFFTNYIPFTEVFYAVIALIAIILLSNFYSKSVFNVRDIADSLKNSNTYIKGIRPNKPTQDYLNQYRVYFSTFSGFYLWIVVFLPQILSEKAGVPFLLGGISILILANIGFEVKKNFDLNNREKNIKYIKNEIFNKFNT